MKLSEELKRCLDGSGCGKCEHHEADTKFICRGLLEKAYERIKGYEDMEENQNKTLEERLQSCCCELRQCGKCEETEEHHK